MYVVGIAVSFTLLICWPLWLFQVHFVFADTKSYFWGGSVIWQTLIELLPSFSETIPTDVVSDVVPESSARLSVGPDGKTTVGRSFTYSALVYTGYLTLGFWSIPVFQALVVVLFVLAILDQTMLQRPILLASGMIYLAGLTTLPWHAVYLIPDIFAAIVILHAALLASRFEDISPSSRVLFTSLAALAVTFHYGYPPLMAGLAGIVLFLRLLQRRLTTWVVAGALLPVLVAPLLNLAASTAVLETTSAAPLRLPILLARSLEDGPAYWYLQDACPGAELAICEAFGDQIPRYVGEFLWGKEGIASLSPDQMARIRDEEFEVLAKAFRAYPVEQLASFLRNVARQTVLIGTGGIRPAEHFAADFQPVPTKRDAPAAAALRHFDRVVVWGTWIGSVPLLIMVLTGQIHRRHLPMIGVVIAGVLLNAAIFGGLSAPDERYQARVIWLLPLMSVLAIGALPGRLRGPPTRRAAREP